MNQRNLGLSVASAIEILWPATPPWFTREFHAVVVSGRNVIASRQGPSGTLKATTPYPLSHKALMHPARLFVRLTLTLVVAASHTAFLSASNGEPGFESIFDGKTLNGWHTSAKTAHSRASANMTGGKWVVEDGAIIGSQDIPGNGGIIITEEQFGDWAA
jgi:hypothetical protein